MAFDFGCRWWGTFEFRPSPEEKGIRIRLKVKSITRTSGCFPRTRNDTALRSSTLKFMTLQTVQLTFPPFANSATFSFLNYWEGSLAWRVSDLSHIPWNFTAVFALWNPLTLSYETLKVYFIRFHNAVGWDYVWFDLTVCWWKGYCCFLFEFHESDSYIYSLIRPRPIAGPVVVFASILYGFGELFGAR